MFLVVLWETRIFPICVHIVIDFLVLGRLDNIQVTQENKEIAFYLIFLEIIGKIVGLGKNWGNKSLNNSIRSEIWKIQLWPKSIEHLKVKIGYNILWLGLYLHFLQLFCLTKVENTPSKVINMGMANVCQKYPNWPAFEFRTSCGLILFVFIIQK